MTDLDDWEIAAIEAIHRDYGELLPYTRASYTMAEEGYKIALERSPMTNIDKRTASELFCWIGNLEMALENLQRAVVDLFSEEDSTSRRALIEQIVSQRQLWGDRPVDAIQRLIVAAQLQKEEEN